MKTALDNIRYHIEELTFIKFLLGKKGNTISPQEWRTFWGETDHSFYTHILLDFEERGWMKGNTGDKGHNFFNTNFYIKKKGQIKKYAKEQGYL